MNCKVVVGSPRRSQPILRSISIQVPCASKIGNCKSSDACLRPISEWLCDGELDVSDLTDYENKQEIIKQLLLKSIIEVNPAVMRNNSYTEIQIHLSIIKAFISRSVITNGCSNDPNVIYHSFRKAR